MFRTKDSVTIDLNTADEAKMNLLYDVLDAGKLDVFFDLNEKKNLYTLVGPDVDVVRNIVKGFDLI